MSRLSPVKTPAGTNTPSPCYYVNFKMLLNAVLKLMEAERGVVLFYNSFCLYLFVFVGVLLFRCSCGQLVTQHSTTSSTSKHEEAPLVQLDIQPVERWSALKHTQTFPTDSYGVIEFQGGGHVNKAMVKQTQLLKETLLLSCGE